MLYIPSASGNNTLSLAPSDLARLHTRLNDLNDWVGANRNSNPIFTLLLQRDPRWSSTTLVTVVQDLISQPFGDRGRADHRLARGAWRSRASSPGPSATGRSRCSPSAGFTFMGLQGLWQESMDTLALTLVAVAVSAG